MNDPSAVRPTRMLADEFGLDEPLLVAELRNMTTQGLANERSRGEGPPFVKLGKKVMYPRAGLRKYIEKNTVTPGRSRTLVEGRKRRRAI